MAVITQRAVAYVVLTAAMVVSVVNSEPTQDKQALLDFLSQVPHASRLRWNASDSACSSWVGVECDPTNSSVYYLRLPGVDLVGLIPPNTLSRLTQLRVLSLRSNRLSGPVPPDFSQLKLLRSAYLQDNLFSGEFPLSLTELTRLTRLDLSSNNFTGPIPFSINNLTHLTGLFLENNHFTGRIPSIAPPGLADFNVSNNRLNGSIPTALARFPASAFSNNLDLCGGPLPPCSPFFPSPAPAPAAEAPHSIASHGRRRRRLSTAAIVAISVAGGVLLLLLILAIIFLLLKRRKSRSRESAKSSQKAPAVVGRGVGAEAAGTSSSKDDVMGGSGAEGGGERNKLIFFHGGGYSFDLEDLLRASAEVLGKGSVGTSYKAVLEEGTTVVVKRLKDVALSKKEFEQQMEVLGGVKHENVLPLRAYYYSKDEKLLVSDYMPDGSLSALLHGSRGSGRTPLDWETRLRIAVSAARGLVHLHASGNIVHGNIKSSNILLLNRQDNSNNQHYNDACVSDFGLNPLFSTTSTPNHRIMGYRAPEVLETRKVTLKSDVYSYGVLLLELLTGKAPNQASLGEEGIDLPRWVQSVVREEWTAEVFDVELMRYHNMEEEMVQLLQIGMSCVATVPDQRPPMQQVLRMIMDMMNRADEAGLRNSSDDALRGGGSDSQTPPLESRASPATSGVTP